MKKQPGEMATMFDLTHSKTTPCNIVEHIVNNSGDDNISLPLALESLLRSLSAFAALW